MSDKKTLYEIVQPQKFIMTPYGEVLPSLRITYTNGRNLSDANLTFALANMKHECTIKNESTGSAGISVYAKKVAEQFAHNPFYEKGILFTADQIEVLFGRLLNEGYENIKAKSR